ncbi:glycosyltransferase family 4 protein [Bacillaceae bacterium S4-13-56]
MKIILATPFFHQNRGNTVTTKRIAHGLHLLGIDNETISITQPLISLPQGDLYHGFNAYRFYQFFKNHKERIHQYVVTLTGTDLNHDLYDPIRRHEVIECLSRAEAIHVFHHSAKKDLVIEIPHVEDKIHVIPQSADIFQIDKVNRYKKSSEFIFLLPAGIRKIKNIPEAISMLEKVHHTHPNMKLWLVGPVLEEDEEKIVQKLVHDNNWIHYFGEFPHEKMGELYKEADVVLNTSLTEGQPAALLEAMGMGKPVIASSNQGNESIIKSNWNGLIYHDQQQFIGHCEKLIQDSSLRETLGSVAKAYIEEHHSLEDEAKAFLEVYQKVLKQPCGGEKK